jgi:hypothetical protein
MGIEELLKSKVVEDIRESGDQQEQLVPLDQIDEVVDIQAVDKITESNTSNSIKEDSKDEFIDTTEKLKSEGNFTDEDISSAVENFQNQSSEKEAAAESHLDIASIIQEKTGGKYQDLESMLAKLEEVQAPVEVFASEAIKKLNDLAKEGKDIFKVLEYERMDPSNLDTSNIDTSVNLLKAKIKREDPEATDREVNMILKSEYGFKSEDDYVDEEEKELAYLKIKRKAKAFKEELIKEKLEYTLPNTEINQKKQQEQAEVQQKAVENWKRTVNETLNSYGEESFKVTDKDDFKYKIKEDTRSNVRKVMSDPAAFWNRYIKSDGTQDMEKFRKDMLFIIDQEEIRKSIYAQGIAYGKKSLVEEFKNPSKKSSSSGATKEQAPSIREQLLSQKFKI